MLTNGIDSVNQTGHPLAPQHIKGSCRRLSNNHSHTSVDILGDSSGIQRDLLSPSYRVSGDGDSPYHQDDQLSNADSGIRSGSYYERTSIPDSVIVGVSDYEDQESSPESSVRLAPPQHERLRNSPKTSVSLNHLLVASQSSLQRAQNNISPSTIHPITMASLSQAISPRHHRLSVPTYLSSSPRQSAVWETPHNSTVIVVTHSGNEIDSHSTKSSIRANTSPCLESSSIQLASGPDDALEEGTGSVGTDVPRCVEMAWPKSWKRRIFYPFLFPLIILLYFTLPNVNKPVSNDILVLKCLKFLVVLAIFLPMDFHWQYHVDNGVLLFNGLVGIRNWRHFLNLTCCMFLPLCIVCCG